MNTNYVTMVNYYLNDEAKIYLGDKDNRVCRFCKRKPPEVSFRNIAHAIPEFVGNKKLFAYYECDLCNAKFSKTLESHMANYMNLYHTISQVKGKRGVPSFKTNKESRIDVKDVVEIEHQHGDNFISIDEENKILTFTSRRASYVPIAVFKCLVKMALTVMPEDELESYKLAIAWINEEDHNASTFTIPSLTLQFSIATGQHPYGFVTCTLFKRKDNSRDIVPHMIFLLAYANYVFQIYLPMSAKDSELIGRDVKMMYFVTPIDIRDGSHALRRVNIDLSKRELVKGEDAIVTMSFDRMEEKLLQPPDDKDSHDQIPACDT